MQATVIAMRRATVVWRAARAAVPCRWRAWRRLTRPAAEAAAGLVVSGLEFRPRDHDIRDGTAFVVVAFPDHA